MCHLLSNTTGKKKGCIRLYAERLRFWGPVRDFEEAGQGFWVVGPGRPARRHTGNTRMLYPPSRFW